MTNTQEPVEHNQVEIECLIRRQNGTHVTMDDTAYHFFPKDGADPSTNPHVATVSHPDHIARFMSIPDGYRLSTVLPPAAPRPSLADTKAQRLGVSEPTTNSEMDLLRQELREVIAEPATLDREGAVALYVTLFKRKPHHNAKASTILHDVFDEATERDIIDTSEITDFDWTALKDAAD